MILKQYREKKDWTKIFISKNVWVEYQKFQQSRLFKILYPTMLKGMAGTMVEGGAGLCKITFQFHKHGWNAYGVELEKEIVEHINKTVGNPIGFQCVNGDVRKTTFAEESIELYVSPGVIEHYDFETQKEIIDEAHRILKPGGTLVLIVPYINNFRIITWPLQLQEENYQKSMGMPFHQYRYTMKDKQLESIWKEKFSLQKTEIIGLHDVKIIPKMFEDNSLLNKCLGSTMVLFLEKNRNI